jgi:1,4-dihydroxy-2-naphthoate octaprenyltransferase
MNSYIRALRAPFLAGSITPVIMGTCLALTERHFSFFNSLVAIIGVSALHLSANLLNDYFDAKGSDPINLRLTPFSGGSRVIQEGEIGPATIMTMSLLFLLLALASAIIMVYAGKPLVIPLGFLGLFAGWAYSSPPLQLMSRGWGELLIFLAFGPLVTLGAYYVNSGSMSLQAFSIGIPQGFLISGVIWVNQFPDYEADKAVGKRNLVVLLGPAISRYLFGFIMILSFVSIIFLVSAFGTTYMIMLGFISFPLAFKAMITVWKNPFNHEALIPAQAMTIQTVIAQGLLLSLGLFLSRFINV